MFRESPVVSLWVGSEPTLVILRHQAAESILTSNVNLNKADAYKYIHPWLGRGLLTSTGNKWRARRKLLTPAFHFKILEDFLPIFNQQTEVLVNKLGEANRETVDITKYITTCALDIICETAMGISISAQSSPESEYCKAINLAGSAFMYRNITWYAWLDFIFYRTNYGKNYLKALEVLHGFTREVIQVAIA